MNKVIFLDVDGTLVNYDGQVPESAVKAIREARKNGHMVYICTGRSRAEVYNFLWDIGLDGMIGGNGNYVESNNKVIMHKLISYDECVEVVDWLYSRNLDFYLESNNGLFASKNFKTGAKQAIAEYSRGKGCKEEMSVEEAFPEMIWDGELYRDDVNKISFVLNSFKDHLDSAEKFPNLKAGTWGGKGESALFGDLGVNDITKASAIETLLNHLNVKKENTVAFGDAKIDIPMFEYCNIGVAMGNGGTEIKGIADLITDDVDNDGIYNAFKKIGLI